MQPYNMGPGRGTCPSCGCAMGTMTGTYFAPAASGCGPGSAYSMGFPGSRYLGGMGGFGFGPWSGPGFGAGFAGFGAMPGTYAMMPAAAMPASSLTASDDQIKHLVEESLDADPAIPFDADINVGVSNGVVTLTGTVPNKRIKHDAGDDAWWIPPVVDINNQLTVSHARKRAATGKGS